jgi:PAS domain S-box-containing protein
MVCLVNDDPAQLEVLARFLREDGWRVHEYTAAADALKDLKRKPPPDVVVTDLHMPGIDGLSFCRLLRSGEYPRLDSVPILVVSATFEGANIREMCMAAGAGAFCEIPCSSDEFRRTVETLVGGGRVESRLRVLVVEDSRVLARALSRRFAECGYEVRYAHDAVGARISFREFNPHVVVLDYHLPDESGSALLEAFTRRVPRPVVVMITADPDPEVALGWFQAGASGYVRKPFELDNLVSYIERLLAERNFLQVEDILMQRNRPQEVQERHLQALVDGAGEALLVVQGERICYANAWTSRLLGAPLEEVLNRPWTDWVHPEDHLPVRALARRLNSRSEGRLSADIRYRTADGSVRWAEVHLGSVAWKGSSALLAAAWDRTAERVVLGSLACINAQLLSGKTEHVQAGKDFLESLRAALSAQVVAVYQFDRSKGTLTLIHAAGSAPSADHLASMLGLRGSQGLPGPFCRRETADDPADGDTVPQIRLPESGSHATWVFSGDGETERPSLLLVRMERSEELSAAEKQLLSVFVSSLALWERDRRADTKSAATERGNAAVFDTLREQVIFLDRNHSIRFVSRSVIEGNGFDREAVVGKRCYDLWHGREAPCADCPVTEAMDQVCTVVKEKVDAEGRTWKIRAVPLQDSSGRVAGAVEVAEEITAQRQVALELETRAKFLAALANSVPGVLFQAEISPDGLPVFTFISARSQEILGIPADSRNGFDEFLEGLERGERERLLKDIRETAGRIASWNYQGEYRRPDGTTIRFRVAAAPHAVGNRLVYTGILHDTTPDFRAEEERERLEAQLIQAQKMESIGRLAGGVAHDFNNMLGVMIGHAELALQKLPPGHDVRQHIQEILTAAERSSRLTHQLLAFARQQPVTPRVLALNEVIEESRTMLQHLIGENIRLHWRMGRQLWPVRLDVGQVHQILTNLVVNARDAIRESGDIFISTSNFVMGNAFCATHAGAVPGEYVLLEVRDTGVGMDEETQRVVFEPFFTTKPAGEGTGLGLATVYGIVKQNEGFVYVTSQPGQGASFQVFFPRYTGEVTFAESSVEEVDPRRLVGSVPRTILVVEDEEAILRLIEERLRISGHTVYAVPNPYQALELAAGLEELDLLISDIVMPGMNGHILARRLAEKFPRLRTIFISGYPSEAIHGEIKASREGTFLSKPFTLETLSGAVERVLFSEATVESDGSDQP